MDSHQQPYASQAQADTTLFPEQTRESLQALAVKLQPLIEGHRLDNLVDLLSLLSDIVDLLDPAMVDRLAQLFEQVTSVGCQSATRYAWPRRSCSESSRQA